MTGAELINIIKENDLEDKQIDAAENDTIIFVKDGKTGKDGIVATWTDIILDIFDGKVRKVEMGRF